MLKTITYRFACINRQIHTMRFGAVRRADTAAWIRENW